MNFEEIKESLSEKLQFTELKEKLELLDKKTLILLCSLCLVILVCLVLLFFSLSSRKNKTSEIKDAFSITEKLYVTPRPDLPKDYNVSRKTQEKWSVEESDKWFTTPTEKEIDSLSISNDTIVNNIVEAAP